MLNAMRGTVLAGLTLFALTACGGGDAAGEAEGTDAAATENATSGVGVGAAATPSSTTRREGPLTLADAESVGFVRTDPKDFAYVGAIDGSGGAWANGNVELYVYENEVPAERLQEFREMAVPAFGWNGLCHVRNLVMVYEDEAACTALRRLE